MNNYCEEVHGKTPYDLGYKLQETFHAGHPGAGTLAAQIQDQLRLGEEFQEFVRGREEADHDFFTTNHGQIP